MNHAFVFPVKIALTWTNVVMFVSGNIYRQIFNISGTLVGNKCVDRSDVHVAGASPVGDIFILDWTRGFNGLGKDSCKMRRETFKFWN